MPRFAPVSAPAGAAGRAATMRNQAGRRRSASPERGYGASPARRRSSETRRSRHVRRRVPEASPPARATSGRVRGTWPRQSGIPAPSHLASAPPRHRTGQADRRGHLARRRARPPNARPRPRPGHALAGCWNRLNRPAPPACSGRHPVGGRAAAGRSQARASECAFSG